MKLNKAIIKIVGMIECPSNFVNKLANDGYKLQENILSKEDRDSSVKYYKNTFYPEVRKMIFLDNDRSSTIKIYQKGKSESLVFYKTDKEYNINLKGSEVYIFPEKTNKKSLGMFSLQMECVQGATDSDVSDINFLLRSFNSKMKADRQKKVMDWIDWIEINVLFGEKIHGDQVTVDDYSGSKFKVFTVVETTEPQKHLERCNLLYDIGTGSPFGSAKGKGPFAPSKNYYDQLMKETMSVFNNWDALALFDSYTIVGNDLMPSRVAEKTFTDTYFRIYILNLYVKFNLFRFKAELHLSPLSVRGQFEKFINTYNLSQISFNFLPNLIYHAQRKALQIDNELEKFNERINRISKGIQEQQQKRTNALLSFVTIVASAGSVMTIYNNLEKVKLFLQWPTNIFYLIIGILALIVGFFLFKYIFSESYRSLSRKVKSLKSLRN